MEHGSSSDREDEEHRRARLLDHAIAAVGITRVGSATGLDTIGLPVWFATRPSSRSLSLSQGKGLTHQQAGISAAMEAIETAVAERADALVSLHGSATELQERGMRLVPLNRCANVKARLFDMRRDRSWVRCFSRRHRDTHYAPYELIGVDLRPDQCWDRSVFRMNSIGLGAGFSFHQAALHALLELIEHDACSSAELFGRNEATAKPVSWSPGIHAGLDAAMLKVHEAGLDVEFFNLPSRFGLPVIGCSVARAIEDKAGPGERRSGGFACRLNAFEAALSALLEAVQSRLTYISAARDDIDPDQYGAGAPWRIWHPEVTLAEICSRFSEQPTHDPAEVYGQICRSVLDAGVFDLFEFDLAGAPDGIHVVRIVAPGMRVAYEDGVTEIGQDLVGTLLQSLAVAA